MKKSQQDKRKKRAFWLYPFIIIILFIISTGGSYFYLKPKFAVESSFIEDIESRRPEPKQSSEKEDSLRLYSSKYTPSIWYNAEFRKDASLVIAENVIRKYIKPYGVKLLDLYMDKEGVIYIDLGNELRKNFKGDAFEEFSIIAGLYKNIKTAIPDFTALKILIEGREVESFGGHIDISKPIGEEIANTIF